MRVLLVRPISKTYVVTPPIGLGYIATALRKIGLQPQFLDCVRDRQNFTGFRNTIARLKPDVVGLQVWSCDLPYVRQSLRIIKEVNPRTTILLGGAHTSGMPVEAMQHFPNADFAFKGEGELGAPLLIKKLRQEPIEFSQIAGLIWRANGEIKVNPPALVENLDALGLPAWDLMPPASYPRAPHQGFATAFPSAPIVATRGCPFNCTFCATHSINGRRIRSRSIQHIFGEIQLLQQRYGVREIHIEDDNFTMDKDFVQDFCRKLLHNKLKIFWFCSSGIRIDSLDQDSLRLMKQAGCTSLTVAIESGVQRILNLMQKSLTLDKVKQSVQLMNQSGYKPTGLFMLGFPGEARADIEQTINFALSLDLKRAQFAIFHPLPGSQIFADLKQKGILKDIDWTKIKPSEVAFSPDGLSAKELKQLQRKAFLKFHLRPRILWYQIREIRSLGHLWFLLKRVFSMLS